MDILEALKIYLQEQIHDPDNQTAEEAPNAIDFDSEQYGYKQGRLQTLQVILHFIWQREAGK